MLTSKSMLENEENHLKLKLREKMYHLSITFQNLGVCKLAITKLEVLISDHQNFLEVCTNNHKAPKKVTHSVKLLRDTITEYQSAIDGIKNDLIKDQRKILQKENVQLLFQFLRLEYLYNKTEMQKMTIDDFIFGISHQNLVFKIADDETHFSNFIKFIK